MAVFRRRQRGESPPTPTTLTVPLAEAPARQRIVVGAQVMSIRIVPASGRPVLEVRIADDTSRAVVRWTGRRSIGGISLGRRLLVEGVATRGPDGLVFVNPSYTLQP